MTDHEPFALGPFSIDACIGRGGMGEVWRGAHVGGAKVAIKVVNPRLAQREETRSAFRDEVRAVARLNHRGIVRVYDYGVISGEVAVASRGALFEGAPYLVMELVEGGTLKSQPRPRRFEQVCAILKEVLDALAHAHARGVIHRDIKPANVLVSASTGRHTLTDFGIARALDREPASGKERKATGTAHYMAPEQILARWRLQGPWTDLYAVGCLAYRLVTGRPPFVNRKVMDIFKAHLRSAPPPIKTKMTCPTGFGRWLTRLLAKRPRERYRFAADAARDLEVLLEGHTVEGASAVSEEAEEFEVEVQLSGSMSLGSAELSHTFPGLEPTLVSAALEDGMFQSGATIVEHPEMFNTTSASSLSKSSDFEQDTLWRYGVLHPDWRREDDRPHEMGLVGVGLGLFELRPPPMVGREAERDALWSALRRVCETRSAEAVIVHGAMGVGKSRLAGWMVERMHELGAATVLKARHSPRGGPSEGLARSIAEHLRCVGLSGEKARAFVTRRVTRELKCEDEVFLRNLFDFLAPSLKNIRPGGVSLGENSDEVLSEPEKTVQALAPTTRIHVMDEMVRMLSRQRPVVVWIDNAQWALEGVLWAAHLLDVRHRHGLPVLILMTISDVHLANQPLISKQVKRLEREPCVEPIGLEPLSDESLRGLMAGLLVFDRALSDQIVERSAGNPMFVVSTLR